MKKIILLTFSLFTFLSFSQNLNKYKYAIIPENFEFLKTKNEFGFCDLVKAAMRKYGFETFSNNEILPLDVANDNKFFVDIVVNSGMIYTKMTMVFKDYRNNVLFTSEEGKSKEKEYQIAFNESFRQAAKSLDLLNDKTQKIETSELKPTKNKILNQAFPAQYVVSSIPNGYNLLSNQKIVFEILNTTKKDFYIAKKDGINGLLLKIDGEWFFEYYKNEELILEKLKITF
ncbi:MAG: hypothetical protein H7174_00025 [Flavobacterium sp.]|nr:hypothetical protein [Flavobacterium sp.]